VRFVNAGLDGRFAEYAAQVAGGDIVLVCDQGRARDARLRLARVGLDSVTGALEQPAATGPRSRPACSARRASPTCPTSSAATRPGRRRP